MISRQLVLEADILKKLNHPGLPKIIDIIEKKDVIWMVMEFIEGKTLKEVLKEEEGFRKRKYYPGENSYVRCCLICIPELRRLFIEI